MTFEDYIDEEVYIMDKAKQRYEELKNKWILLSKHRREMELLEKYIKLKESFIKQVASMEEVK